MGKISWGRVVVGGIVAGIVLNVADFLVYGKLLAPDFAAAMQALGKPATAMSGAVTLFVVLDFVYGIALLWLYAAMRPRFGAGPKTAAIAGLAVWFFISLMHALGEAPMGLMPQRIYTVGVIASVIVLPLAAVIGAYFYKEA